MPVGDRLLAIDFFGGISDLFRCDFSPEQMDTGDVQQGMEKLACEK